VNKGKKGRTTALRGPGSRCTYFLLAPASGSSCTPPVSGSVPVVCSGNADCSKLSHISNGGLERIEEGVGAFDARHVAAVVDRI
jgi:hypothetical protein